MRMIQGRHPRSRRPGPHAAGSAGFSLVELMVALGVMLVVTFAAVAFIVSVARANSEDLRVTRLTQELRGLSEIVGREIRRARYVADPIDNIGKGGTAAGFDEVRIIPLAAAPATRHCVSLRYSLPPEEVDATCVAGTCTRSIYVDANGGLFMANNLNCNGGLLLSSANVQITSLTFSNDPAAPPPSVAGDVIVGRFARSRLAARLANETGDLATLSRSFQQDNYIRSGSVVTP